MKHLILGGVVAVFLLGASVIAQAPDVLIVSADYDGDGKADLGTYQPSTGQWVILLSGSHPLSDGILSVRWGTVGDIPAPADYDGDGKADIAIYRPSTGVWWVLRSSCNFGCYSNRAIKSGL